MKIVKTWVTLYFIKGKAQVEVSMNYKTKSYTLMTEHEDNLVAIKSETDKDINVSIDKAKCVTAALKYIKSELTN